MENTKAKMTFWQKIENLWYYYKWWIILGVIFLVAAIVGANFISANTKQKSGDVNIISVFAHDLTAKDFDIAERVAADINDVNKNGEKDVNLKSYYITEKQTTSNDQMAKGEVDAELSKCSGGVMLFDAPNLDLYLKKDIFEPIGNYIDLSQIPKEEIVYKDDVAIAVKLKKSQLLKDMGFIIDEIYASVMFLPENPSGEILEKNENAKIVIKKLIQKEDVEN